jgi:hypothetical protein
MHDANSKGSPSGGSTLVTIATFREPASANLARTELEAAEIPVFVQGETANSMIPGAFSARLLVRADDEAAARTIIDELDLSPFTLEEVTAAELANEAESKGNAE